MEPDEIRAEVQRRKKRAADLGIREVVRGLIKHRDHYRAWLRDDPQFAARLLYPDIILSGDEVRFSIGPATFQLKYKDEPVSSDYDDFHSKGNIPSDHSREALTLKVNGENVFEFAVNKSTDWDQFGPTYHEYFGETVRFIEGPWVTEVTEFVLKAQAHSTSAVKERNAPREAKEIEDLKRRFGL
jgi:hypothetical protein